MAQDLFTNYARDGILSRDSFHDLCKSLFLPGDSIKEERVQSLFSHFNKKQDGRLTEGEFQLCWDEWIYKVLNPKNALLVVDVQNDFITGSLALKNCPAGEDGAEVIPVINRVLDGCSFEVVSYSQDWHPSNHISFIDNIHLRKTHPTSKIGQKEAKVYDEVIFATEPLVSQILWPAHCLQDSEGARLHQDLKMTSGHLLTHKGTHPEYDSYSSFFNNLHNLHTDLNDRLLERGVTDVFVCGIAFDYCVKFTARDARDLGFGCVILEDACRSISDEGRRSARDLLLRRDCIVSTTDQLSKYLERNVRHPDLAFSGYRPQKP